MAGLKFYWRNQVTSNKERTEVFVIKKKLLMILFTNNDCKEKSLNLRLKTSWQTRCKQKTRLELEFSRVKGIRTHHTPPPSRSMQEVNQSRQKINWLMLFKFWPNIRNAQVNHSINGYSKKIKIFDIKSCPSFIYFDHFHALSRCVVIMFLNWLHLPLPSHLINMSEVI